MRTGETLDLIAEKTKIPREWLHWSERVAEPYVDVVHPTAGKIANVYFPSGAGTDFSREYLRDLHLKRMATVAFERHEIRDRDQGRFLLSRRHEDGGWDSNMAAEVLIGFWPTIYVGGDIDSCVFAYGPKDYRERIAWIGGHCDVGYYVAQKASIGTRSGDGMNVFSIDAAEDEIRERLDTYISDAEIEDDGISETIEDDILSHTWESPENLREFILGELGEPIISEVIAQPEFVNLDNQELALALKPWAKERALRMSCEDDPVVKAVSELLEDGLPDTNDLVIQELHNRLGRDGDGFMDDFYSVGMVVDPKVYYAWGAMRRLHCLLLIEEEKESDDSDRTSKD